MTSLPVPAADKTSPQHDAATTMLHHRDGARFPPDVMLGIQAKEFNLGFIRPSTPIAQFGRAASSRKSLDGSKHHPITNDGGHCVLGDLQCCKNVLAPFPRSVPRHNRVSELYRQFLLGFCSDMHCQLWNVI